ncbi:putative Unsaturated glucuronyl hydrolase [Glarea lozoyensis 74030]|uniref:Putative Unsaturated glucuronyl hydrolase n=1 Tax=Glarea lozoyensis (strain ATCC 74030 / MF5533) TaxID=1104152 RepID=H0EUS6_GLAL7|nr:putative Unsaturated glucuronyl hydrolase [Glarea lozoyensis 74030]
MAIFQPLSNATYTPMADNMLNLDLLFWAATELRDPTLRNIAISHAKTSQKHHVRSDSSTLHVVNFDQATGAVKAKMTNQGYSDDSCWSRGQALLPRTSPGQRDPALGFCGSFDDRAAHGYECCNGCLLWDVALTRSVDRNGRTVPVFEGGAAYAYIGM